ncbi:MAG: uracil-DNA glycosylase [Gaiellales bacterium]
MAAATDPQHSHQELAALAAEVATCERCRLAEGRTRVVAGDGDPDADLMLVGEAPGFHEDRQGVPFVGAAGALLDRLLGSIGLAREDVYVANVLRCRPPGNREPLPDELGACEGYLFRELALVRPAVVATLGNLATRLLSGRAGPITTVHGQPRRLTIGDVTVTLYPLYHPAAALYTPSMLRTLEEDFARLPGILAASSAAVPSGPLSELEPPAAATASAEPVEQLELF